MNKDAKILIACEESGIVVNEFRELGFMNAFSCDVLPTSGGHPEWHIQGDVTPLLEQEWDMIIAFPPCTYLTNAGTRHFSLRLNTQEKVDARIKMREEAAKFFMLFVNAQCQRIAIENPVGYMNSTFRKPDQIIHPYYFGEPVQKRTCLWLKGLPLLVPSEMLQKPEPVYICQGDKCKGKRINWCEALKTGTGKGSQKERAKARSKTFIGIAKAFATQYTAFINSGMAVSEWENLLRGLGILRRNAIIDKYVQL